MSNDAETNFLLTFTEMDESYDDQNEDADELPIGEEVDHPTCPFDAPTVECSGQNLSKQRKVLNAGLRNSPEKRLRKVGRGRMFHSFPDDADS